ncbi:MAG: peptide chain release factor 1 [Candidatus Omnitrophota bacterium]
MINPDKLKKEYEKISGQLSSEEVLKDREKYSTLAKRFAYLEKLIKLLDSRQNLFNQKQHLKKVIADPKEDADLKLLAQQELKQLSGEIEAVDLEIEDKVFEENEPERDVIIEIRPAAGGDEAALFGAVLFKMYSKYGEKKGWKIEVLSSSPTGIGGFKEVIFSVKGKGAFSRLKFESGVHRVQRVPATESGGRVHTSTATVAVLVEPKEVELKLNYEDLRIDTFRSSGAGGQHVNVTDSAVRITHLPTNTVVSCQDERSQIKNREKALRVIKARIMEKMMRDEAKKISQSRKVQVGTGERSEKIRTYNFSERRVTDHRVNFTLYRLEAVLEGDLEEIGKRLVAEERKKIYEIKGLV